MVRVALRFTKAQDCGFCCQRRRRPPPKRPLNLAPPPPKARARGRNICARERIACGLGAPMRRLKFRDGIVA